MSELAPRIDQVMQERIAMARMICVLSMIFVHVPDGLTDATLYTLETGSFSLFLEGFLVEGPGRASAALLSVVSGYLAATTLLKPGSSVTKLYRRRFMSIIVPMVFWACVTYLLYFLVSQTRPTFIDDATTLLDKLNIIFFITEMPVGATMHLGFLRDLFVCVLLSPLLLIGVQRMAWLILPLLCLVYLFEHSQSLILILRPLVIFAFCIGIYLATRKVRLNALDKYWPLFVVLSVISTIVILLVNSGVADETVQMFAANDLQFNETVLYPVSRLFGSLAIWTLIPLALGGKLQVWTKRYTPYLFAAFCSHYLVLTLMFYGIWSPLFGGRESLVFVLWFVAAPFLSMTAAVLMVKVAERIAPFLATLITGGRMRTAKPASKPLTERGRQGAMLGVWLAVTRIFDSVATAVGSAWRGVREAGRRLLPGRR